MEASMRVEVRNVTKRFGSYTALDDVTLDIEEGRFCALLGPSGSGKTTLLRIVAGLEFPDQGVVRFAGENVLDRNVRDRGVGFVFQHYALFRHMTVFENVAFGLRVRPRATRPSRQEIARRVGELLELVQLEWLADRYPSQLSGGQRQRVALARALAIEPRILLLDEPFGALDAKVRKELRRWLRELHKRLGLTSIFVTHDQEEAMELADQVVVMNGGRIEQVGSARDVYARPATPFVYDFLGSSNRLDCVVERGWAVVEGAGIPLPPDVVIDEGAAVLYVRPEDFVLSRGNGSDGLLAEVREVIQSGPLVRIELRTTRQGRRVEVDLPRASSELAGLEPGARVAVRPQAFGIFPASRASEAQAAKEVELAGAPQS
jgi:sulfate transport system ATP-binding protein